MNPVSGPVTRPGSPLLEGSDIRMLTPRRTPTYLIAHMRTLSNSFFALLFASLLMVGCGGEAADTSTTDAAADATEETAVDAIVIEANDMLQFTVTEFTVTEGEEVTVVLKNVGQMAKEMGGHNIVFLTEGADLQAFGVAAAGAADTAYIPADMADWVMASSELLGPGEEATVTFTAPAAGTYEFVCSFPGHFGTMRGVMTVEAVM